VLHCGCIMRNALWMFETETTKTATHAGVSERLEPRYSSVATRNCVVHMAHSYQYHRSYKLVRGVLNSTLCHPICVYETANFS